MVASGVKARRPVWLLPVGVYLLVVAYLTLAPRVGTSGSLTPNFVPFASIIELLFYSAAAPAVVLKNLVGNLVLSLRSLLGSSSASDGRWPRRSAPLRERACSLRWCRDWGSRTVDKQTWTTCS